MKKERSRRSSSTRSSSSRGHRCCCAALLLASSSSPSCAALRVVVPDNRRHRHAGGGFGATGLSTITNKPIAFAASRASSSAAPQSEDRRRRERKRPRKENGGNGSGFTDEVRALAQTRFEGPTNLPNLLAADGSTAGGRRRRPHVPSWLAAPTDDGGTVHADGHGSVITRTGYDAATVARASVSRLRTALERHHRYLDIGGGGFTDQDVEDITDALRISAGDDWSTLSGAAEFLWLLLSVEENQFSAVNDGGDDGDDIVDRQPFAMMDRDTLIASAFHYCDCVSARKSGVYELVSRAVRGTEGTTASFADEWGRQLLPPPTQSGGDRRSVPRDDDDDDDDESAAASPSPISPPDDEDTASARRFDGLDDGTVSDPDWAVAASMSGVPASSDRGSDGTSSPLAGGGGVGGGGGGGGDDGGDDGGSGDGGGSGVGRFGADAARIAQATARVKRAEILANAVVYPGIGGGSDYYSMTGSTNDGDGGEGDGDGGGGGGRGGTRTRRGSGGRSSRLDEAETLRSLLISVTDDWRALAIRSVACLYRLRGIIRFGRGERNLEVVKTAREALYVYAPLAQRLGMHRLKADLEGLAFCLLYRRQYAAAAALYEQSGDVMRDVEVFATTTVEESLRDDEILMDQLDSLKVTSRVKEPYSLWKKLLKQRTRMIRNGEAPDELSVQDVQDAIALRVIIRARRLSPTEDEESVRARECLLCYYAQKIVLESCPATDVGRMKDYIANPKLNGYQSLHYTASVFRHGIDWPFEVQVRSEEMHRLAEFGVAAHWDYKLEGNAVAKISSPPSPPVGLRLDTADDIAKKLEQASVVSASQEEKEESREEKASSPLVVEVNADVAPAADENDVQEEDADEATRTDMITSYIDALTTARDDLVQRQVFIFVSPSDSALDGKILPLPFGASVADALEEAGDRYGIELRGGEGNEGEEDAAMELFRNGQATDLNEELHNGDVLTLPLPGGFRKEGYKDRIEQDKL